MLPTKEDHARREPWSLHVLVVDDEALIRWSLTETLAEAGHRVSEAADGEAALQALSTDEPLILPTRSALSQWNTDMPPTPRSREGADYSHRLAE